jgi:two-component system NtrC family sensor kinase
MPGDPPAQRRPKPSLKAELLFSLTFLALGALMLATVTALVAPMLEESGFKLLIALIVGDVAVFVFFGRFIIVRHVTQPIDVLVRATGEVADGRLEQRAPEAPTRELDALARSVNRMTERLLDAQGALVSAEKLATVGRLAAGIAHEVGNPLSAAGNYTEVLRRRGADGEVVAGLQRELTRIDAIVRSLLDYARPRAAAREALDLSAVAAGAVELLRAQGTLRPVRVDTSGLTAAGVAGDPVALEQVCVNLLLNAVDAAGDGGAITLACGPADLGETGAPRRVTDPGAPAAHPAARAALAPRFLAGAPGGRAVQLIVGDSGSGVAEGDVARIFDPFMTTKPPGKGTGLGLAIVQRIVHEHGGRVDVRRAREGGAAFVVTLPARA